jgi:hypothetical protein
LQVFAATIHKSQFEGYRRINVMKNNSQNDTDETPVVKSPLVERRQFLQTAAVAGLVGAALRTSVFGQSASSPAPTKETRDQLRQDMIEGIEDDIKKDLEMRARSKEELPKPAGLRQGGMLDARFSVYYKTSVPEAMRLLTTYFAAFSDRDMAAVHTAFPVCHVRRN